MSISPFGSGKSQPVSSSSSIPPQRSETEPVSLSQALIITAGMAGLIGLFSGVIIRFSLSNSPNARFLSPLQTFPALSSWTPELPQATADSHYLPGGTNTYQGSDGPESARPQVSETAPIPTFEPSSEAEDAWFDETDDAVTDSWDNPTDSVDTAPAEFFETDEAFPDEPYPAQELNDNEYWADDFPAEEPVVLDDSYPDLSDPIGNEVPVEDDYTDDVYQEEYVEEDYYGYEEDYYEDAPAELPVTE